MKCQKEDILTFSNVLGESFISREKVDMYFKKKDGCSPTMYSHATYANLSKTDAKSIRNE